MSRELVEQLIVLRNLAGTNRKARKDTALSVLEAAVSIKDLLARELPDLPIERMIPKPKPINFWMTAYDSAAVEAFCRQLIPYARTLRDRNRTDTGDGAVRRVVPATKDVFIVHGHDHGNLLRVRTMLKERFLLNPIILSEQAGKGRSIIEKFEDEAGSAGFAIALLTPDDVVSSSGGIKQARPNVVFELGWFYGRLGRDRVCILCKTGTEIHSDLSGIIRIEFQNSVEEGLIELERELRAAQLVL